VSEIGRVSLKACSLGYEDVIVPDILVESGKKVDISIEPCEKLLQAHEIVVSVKMEGHTAINQMSSISTHTIRAADAERYAGGFYDPPRIVNSFAGVVTANNDESNDIVI
jgi:hypothetical protein